MPRPRKQPAPVTPPTDTNDDIVQADAEERVYNRVNVPEAMRLRARGWSYAKIAEKQGVDTAAVFRCIKKILGLMDDPIANQAYTQNKVQMLEAAERVMVGHMVNPDKLKTASVNNVAYAFQQLHNARRLEAGLSTDNVDLHVAYEAFKRKESEKSYTTKLLADRLNELGIDACEIEALPCELPRETEARGTLEASQDASD